MSKTTRVAFIGTGGIAGQHLSALKTIQGVNVVGLYDKNRDKAEARQAEFGGEVFGSPGKMLDGAQPDAVYICLPPHAHGKAEAACIDHRIPFLAEKPLSNDLALAKRIAARVKRTGLLAVAGYMNRYRKGVQRARKLLARRPVSLIYGGWLGGTPRNHPWLTQKRLSGGQILEQTTHTFDLLRYLCGEAVSVSAGAATGFVPRSRLYQTDDASSALIKMKSGAVANIMSSWSAGPGGGLFLTLTGPDIKVALTGWEHSVEIVSADGKIHETYPGEQNIFELEDRAFIRAVRTGNRSGILCDYADGVRSLAVCAAANESITTGKPVTVR